MLNVADQTVKARQLVSDQITALQQNQLRTTLDVSFANVNLADAKLLLSQAHNEVSSAQADLAAAMGVPSDAAFAPAEETATGSLPATLEPLLRDALQNRPELKDLRLEQSAAEHFVEANMISSPTAALP